MLVVDLPEGEHLASVSSSESVKLISSILKTYIHSKTHTKMDIEYTWIY